MHTNYCQLMICIVHLLFNQCAGIIAFLLVAILIVSIVETEAKEGPNTFNSETILSCILWEEILFIYIYIFFFQITQICLGCDGP